MKSMLKVRLGQEIVSKHAFEVLSDVEWKFYLQVRDK